MTGTSTFDPLWASAPGRTIATRLAELELSVGDFAEQIGSSAANVEGLLSGDTPITIDLARRLSDILGASPEFWFARDCRYREALERIETKDWVDHLPFGEMASVGWVASARDWLDKSRLLFSFFDVKDLHDWKSTYQPLLAQAHLRASQTASVNDGALAAWLHVATLSAARTKVAVFDQNRLRASVEDIRRLTRIKAPETFVPLLSALLAESGVTLVVQRTIRGAPVSGAARVLPEGTAMLAVTCRYLTDDHLWFTVFHEIGHLLLHADRGLYVDDLSESAANSAADEAEANRFAGEALLPPDARSSLPTRRLSIRDVIGIAKRAGVSPGVVVGQLQFDERLPYKHALNSAKRRYRWDGPTLRSA